MSETELELDMDELEGAEDFLEYFKIEFDQKVVHVNRLHILQRFHDYVAQAESIPEGEEEQYNFYRDLLHGAYEDFVRSDALTEKVFKVFHMHEPQQTFVPMGDLKIQS
jgi:nitrogenase-stabilizing/protective protein